MRPGSPARYALPVLAAALLLGGLAALPALAAGVGCAGEWANSPVCRERQAAIDARARVDAVMERLAVVDEPPWDAEEFAAAEELRRQGMALYRDEYFGDAAARFQGALTRLTAIGDAFEALVRHRLATGQSFLDTGNYRAAIAEFEAVLHWQPGLAEAANGLATAEQGVEALALLQEANQLIERGELRAAEKTLQAVPSGLLRPGVGDARARIVALRRQDRFKGSMSSGFAHLDRGEWAQAEAAFQAALQADPGSVAAQEALEDVRRRQIDAELATRRTEVEAALNAERWPEAQASLRRIRQLAPNDALAADRLVRVAWLVDIEGRIDAFLSQPGRLATTAVRNQAADLLVEAAKRGDHGVRIGGKLVDLRTAVAAWGRRVQLTLRSDNRTEVRIMPGRGLGKFRQLQLEVLPGDYVLSGRRAGYREARLPFAVPLESGPLAFEIVCDERF